MRIKWTKRARYQFLKEVDYISQDNPKAASDVAVIVIEKINLLKIMPEMGRHGRVDGTRELIISNLPYIVFYRIQGKIIYISRIFHTSRKWEN